MDDHSYSQDFINTAEARIKRQVEGNGVEPASINLKIKRQGVAILEGQTSFEIDCNIQSAQQKGKLNQGRIIQTGQLEAEISQFKNTLSGKSNIDKLAKDQITSLPLKGFGADKQTRELISEKSILTEHVSCRNCNGQGNMKCPTCQGFAKVKCPKCFGRGDTQCNVCMGHGKTQDGKQCYNCQGRGEVFCYQCQGKKQIPCKNCHMKGNVTCTNCQGKGSNSVVTTLTPLLKLTAVIHIADLENDPKRMVGKIGGLALAQGGHISVDTVAPPEQEEVERAYYEAEPEDFTNNTIFYEAKMPWAVAETVVDGKPHDITFAGKKGAVCESGNFMQQIIQPHLQNLDLSIQKKGEIQSIIKEACNLRVSRETFSLLGKNKPKKVMQHLYKSYPLGWAKKDIQAFVSVAYNALKIATRRPRYIGLSIGLLLSFVLNYLWFIANINADFGLTLPLSYITSFLPLAAGVLISILSIKITGFIMFQSLMRDIGIKSKNTPPMGKAGLYSIIANFLIWGGFIASAYFNLY